MARKSPGRIEDETVQKYFKKQALEMARKLAKQPADTIEPEGSLADVNTWNEEKAEKLKGLPSDQLTPEMRKFLAYMALKPKKLN